jgi:membrane-associated protease RseP (regulator of RpoE activity)
VALFLATTASVFIAGATYQLNDKVQVPSGLSGRLELLLSGWTFAVPLLAILVCHEFGHWFAARHHKVPASLPYFIPLPFVGALGTLGAVIAMPERIRSRNALLDIGAAGPLAGLAVTIPVLAIGLSLSKVEALPAHYMQEGQSLLYALLKRLFVGPIPPGHDVFLHPTAFAGWAGLMLTMINLLPWGQLDGGHIAFALFGNRQHRFARLVRYSLLVLFVFNLATLLHPLQSGAPAMSFADAVSNSTFWLIWFVITGVMGRFFGKDHPPFEEGELSPARAALAWFTLLCFVMLFMPAPMTVH